MTGEPITLALQPQIEAALGTLRHGTGAQCLSDHAFSNLYLFREAHGYRYLPGDWPGVAGHTYDGTRHFLPLFDVAVAPPAVLAGLIQAHGCLYPVASAQAEALPAERFAAVASPDDADYLYEAATLRDYPGRALAKKRNLVRQFLSQHAPHAVRFDASQADAARAVLRGWMAHKAKGEGEADERACLEAIDQAPRFGLEGFVHRVGALPVAFLLVQQLQPGVFAVRFAKGLDSHVGVYPYMFQHFCLAFERPVHWLNFEQDLGHAGFRRSKRSYRPSALLSKWRVALRGG